MEITLTTEQREELLQNAIQVRKMAYAPYSNYKVGAALLTSSGKVFTGVNVENASYPMSLCAERVAIFKAVTEGEKGFVAIAVVSDNGGTPCGACRQVLAEFGMDTLVMIADMHGNLKQEAKLSELLPGAFGPKDLGK